MRSNIWRFANAENKIVELSVYSATSFFSRLRGLLFRQPIREGEALWIKPCNSIHTLGMRYSIDVLFLDAKLNVIAIHSDVGVGRFKYCRSATSVLEILGRSAQKLAITPGLKLNIVEQ